MVLSRTVFMCLLCVVSLIDVNTERSTPKEVITPTGSTIPPEITTPAENTAPTVDVTDYKICEDTPPGFEAFTIVASDAENDPLTFLLTGANAEYFTLNKNTGLVTVKKHLDREAYNVLQLRVIVSDGFTSSSYDINVKLSDDNDNKPQFEGTPYRFNFSENTPVGSSLFKVNATDKDIGLAGVVQYSITEVTPDSGLSLFSISETSGEVTLTGRLNYTELSIFYELTIKATDGGGKCFFDETTYLSSVALTIIKVNDVPDLDPMFLGAPYFGKVPENSPQGWSVLKVTAVDQDTEVNAKIKYNITASSKDNWFAISDDGVIYVASEFDKEDLNGADTVTLTVKATESELNIYGVYASNTTIIPILVNSNKPEFYMCGITCEKESSFTGKVPENYGGSIDIKMTVIVRDKVSSTKLTLVGAYSDVFSVEPQFTEADSSVQLVVRQPQKLDFEQTHHMTVKVIATDQNDTSLCSTATVTINIQDINDNKPEFNSSNRVFSIEVESTRKGTPVARVTAKDKDADKQIEFKVTAAQFNDSNNQTHDMGLLFEAITELQNDIYVGTIQTTEKLNVTLKGKYCVTVTATDTGGLFASKGLEIFTVDEVNEVQLTFSSSVEEVEEKLDDILSVLSAATDATIGIVSIIPVTSESETIIIAHFINSNGTTLTADEVEEMVSDPKYSSELAILGLREVRGPQEPTDEPMEVPLGLLAGLLLVMAVLITSFMYSHRRRKQKEAKAEESGYVVEPDDQNSGPVVPYNRGGTNPLYDRNFDNFLDPDFEENNKSYDMDTVSISSLDHIIHLRTQRLMKLIQEKEEDRGLPEYTEPFGGIQAQQGYATNQINSHQHPFSLQSYCQGGGLSEYTEPSGPIHTQQGFSTNRTNSVQHPFFVQYSS